MIVVDTQIVVWLSTDQQKLSAKALSTIKQCRLNGTDVAISDITLWELAFGVARGRIPVHRPLRDALTELSGMYRVIPIDAVIAEHSTRFVEPFPGDPADRIIAATAFANGCPLITADAGIRKSGQVACIW